MKIGILGSGSVGISLAKGFIAEGYQVWIATREPDSEKGHTLKEAVEGATVADFSTAAREAELAILCVKWDGVESAITAAGPGNLAGKIVIDTSNVIKQESGAFVYNGGEISAGERVQAWLQGSHVVKAFNTVGAAMMYKPEFDSQKPTMFIAGDDSEAKKIVQDIVTAFGWEPLDCGGLLAARSLEPMATVWINHAMSSGSPHHAYKML
jgi:predicted dinucleotide-binding enzyme